MALNEMTGTGTGTKEENLDNKNDNNTEQQKLLQSPKESSYDESYKFWSGLMV
jgi:hypothetical protein